LLLPSSAGVTDRTLFIDDAAKRLGVSRRTVYYRIRQGRLRTIRTRCGTQRVLVSSIDELLREEADKRRAERLDVDAPIGPDQAAC
jgi:excisionase family DNA binding protein